MFFLRGDCLLCGALVTEKAAAVIPLRPMFTKGLNAKGFPVAGVL